MEKILARKVAKTTDEPNKWKTWRFWRNLVLLFVVASWIGHMIEFTCAGLKALLFGPEAWGYIPKTIFWLAEPYGIGAVLLVLLVKPLMKKLGWVRVYILSVIVTTFSEFICGLGINIVTGSNSVWDYSGRPLNLWGMVCLSNSLLFGACAVIFLYWVLPWMESLERKMDQVILNVLFGISAVGYPIYAVWKVITTLSPG